MITHVCMFKLQQENHKEILDKAVKLAESLYTIPNAVKGEVVVHDTLADSSNYDLCLLFDFETYEDLDAYQKHPVHVSFKNYVVSHMISRACIDYRK